VLQQELEQFQKELKQEEQLKNLYKSKKQETKEASDKLEKEANKYLEKGKA